RWVDSTGTVRPAPSGPSCGGSREKNRHQVFRMIEPDRSALIRTLSYRPPQGWSGAPPRRRISTWSCRIADRSAWSRRLRPRARRLLLDRFSSSQSYSFSRYRSVCISHEPEAGPKEWEGVWSIHSKQLTFREGQRLRLIKSFLQVRVEPSHKRCGKHVLRGPHASHDAPGACHEEGLHQAVHSGDSLDGSRSSVT